MNTQFKQEWTNQDFKTVNKAVYKWLNSRFFETHHSPNANPFIGANWAQIENILGLAYTSTGLWACYGVCNTSLYLDAQHIYKVEFFTLSNTGFVFAVCWDKDENEILIPIS